MLHLNFVVQDDLNDRRKALGVTWRELLTLGLTTLEGNPRIKDPIPVKTENPPDIDRSDIEENLKIAVQGITKAWDLIKTS